MHKRALIIKRISQKVSGQTFDAVSGVLLILFLLECLNSLGIRKNSEKGRDGAHDGTFVPSFEE